MTHASTVDWVVTSGLCVGCGTCEAVCNRNAIRMVIHQREGVYIPALVRDRCNECGLCLMVCPGHVVDFAELNQRVFGKDAEDIALGSHIDCHMGCATDHSVRFNAASGGLVTALLSFALEEGIIDGALVTAMKRDDPLEPQPFIARTREEIVAASKSKYCPVPANVALREILDADEGQRFAVVGLPCHIQGLRKAETVIKRLRPKIAMCFALVCSHSDSFHETDFLLRKHGVEKKDVTEVTYRGPGWPGYLTIRTRDGTQRAVPFDEYIAAHEGYFFTPRRCTLCCDMGGRLADISFMDAWLPEVRSRDSVGTSIIVCRTAMGHDLCRNAAVRGRVDLGELSADDALRSQGSARMSNRDLKAHVLFARLRGRSTPHYEIDVPRPGLLNYVRALVIHLNMWVSSRRRLHGLILPMIRAESVLSGRARSRVGSGIQSTRCSGA